MPPEYFEKAMEEGYRTMFPMRGQIPWEDRQAIALYIKALQRSRHSQLAELPEQDQKRLAEIK